MCQHSQTNAKAEETLAASWRQIPPPRIHNPTRADWLTAVSRNVQDAQCHTSFPTICHGSKWYLKQKGTNWLFYPWSQLLHLHNGPLLDNTWISCFEWYVMFHQQRKPRTLPTTHCASLKTANTAPAGFHGVARQRCKWTGFQWTRETYFATSETIAWLRDAPKNASTRTQNKWRSSSIAASL